MAKETHGRVNESSRYKTKICSEKKATYIRIKLLINKMFMQNSTFNKLCLWCMAFASPCIVY